MSANTLPTPERSTAHPIYRAAAAIATVLALVVAWLAVDSFSSWSNSAGGYLALALAYASVLFAGATELIGPRLYELALLPTHDWPCVEVTYINCLTGDVLGSNREAKVVAQREPMNYCAWLDLRPAEALMALAAAVLACVVLLCTIPS